MRHLFTLSAFLLLACHGPAALAGTMVKCVAADGKTTYSDLPCPAKAKAVREFAIEAPPAAAPQKPPANCGNNELSRPCTLSEQERLRKADRDFKERHAKRVREQDDELARGMAIDRQVEQAAIAERGRQDAEAKRLRDESAVRDMRVRECQSRGLPSNC